MPAPNRQLGSIEFTLMVSAMMALTAMGIDLMLPAFDEMRADLGLESDPTAISATVTAYFLGLAVGQLFYGLLADRYGRRRALYLGLAVYGFAAVGSALAPSLAVLILARLVWGFGAAGSRVISVALVRDRYRGAQMAQAMSYVMSIFIMVPVFAPSLGAILAAAAGWRWIFWTCALFAVAMAAWALRLPETLKPENRLDLGLANVGATVKRVVNNRVTGGYLVAMTLMMGVFMSYLASSELIIGDIFGYEDEFPMIFGGIALVLAASAFMNARVVVRFGIARVITTGWIGYATGATLLLVSTLAADGVPSFRTFVICLSIILASHMLLFPNMNTRAMEPLGDIAGTAAAVIGFVSMGGGALIGAVIDRGIETTITALALSYFIVALLCGAMVVWVRRGAPAGVGATAVAALEAN
jgi:DHA1 family bicyclomycin/chloramphenicol resistance-like MFS transporter